MLERQRVSVMPPRGIEPIHRYREWSEIPVDKPVWRASEPAVTPDSVPKTVIATHGYTHGRSPHTPERKVMPHANLLSSTDVARPPSRPVKVEGA